MKFPTASAFVVVVAAIVPFATGCAEEGAEAPEVAYPVGTTTLRSAPVEAPTPVGPASYEQVSYGAATDSRDVVIGEDTDTSETQYGDTDPAALTDFRDTLDAYGSWVEDPTYGTTWVPSPSVVGADFTPYQTAGHWAYDDDYTWVSDYSWGWAPFHYGRWVYGGGLGWEWIPGREYAGAWVSWRYGWGDWGYVGWAPLAPTWCWHRGVAVGIGFVPVAPYGFVATGDLFHPSVATRLVAGERVGVIAAHTQPWSPAGGAVAGRVLARPGIGGPPPSTLRIPPTAVVALGANRGVMQARTFARPSTAMAMGASAPMGWARGSVTNSNVAVGHAAAMAAAAPAYGGMTSRSWSPSASYGSMARSAPAYGGGARSAAPAYSPPAASHFGGRFGAGFAGSAASQGPTYAPPSPASGGAARPYFAPSTPSGAGPRVYTAPAQHYAGGAPAYSSPRVSAPSYSAPASHSSAPSYSAPAFHGSTGGGATGGFHGGGGYSSGSHGGGFSGGGGFHGGGGGHGGGHR
ncbi:MAG: hypothetical protein M3O46_20705 [Myxococcota bacterium]|nr:hypothetical protein [Myxococcota bacterium]